MTTSSELTVILRALCFSGAVNIVVEVYGGNPRYVCSIRGSSMDTWTVAYDADPLKALLRAVERLEDKRDLI